MEEATGVGEAGMKDTEGGLTTTEEGVGIVGEEEVGDEAVVADISGMIIGMTMIVERMTGGKEIGDTDATPLHVGLDHAHPFTNGLQVLEVLLGLGLHGQKLALHLRNELLPGGLDHDQPLHRIDLRDTAEVPSSGILQPRLYHLLECLRFPKIPSRLDVDLIASKDSLASPS